eukprot:TRINITY_DN4709_c0_g1_i3.p1 TRINITY_DN4709_c0_g1~~TRINITY_DN4709_c0_g1_i3.p1  ORF type:complete len:505 (-),score=105.07 TRINITY_DN4709_c0_g1_i3:1442-2740(-)
MAEAIQGTAQALVALPAGWLADVFSRTSVLRTSAIAGVLAALVCCAALRLLQRPSFVLMCVGLALVGVYKGMWNPPLQAIFADSVPAGQRSKFFTMKFVVLIVSTASGPLLSIFLFLWLGDKWTFPELSSVFIIGVLATIPISGLLCLFKHVDIDAPPDRQAGGEEEHQALLASGDHEDEEDAMTSSSGEGEELLSYVVNLGVRKFRVSQRKVPMIVAVSDFVSGLGSGMTIKFFPLFFENECKMRPITVSLIFVVTPLCCAIISGICQKISLKTGRIQITIAIRAVGISALALMAYLSDYWQTFWIITPVFVARSALMNSTTPLVRSVVMDYSSPRNRAKWSSLESITSFGWSGSAALGGLLADRYGYGGTFYGTALLQLLSTLILALVLPVVPIESPVFATKEFKTQAKQTSPTPSPTEEHRKLSTATAS